jgi:hypothetical protein
MDVLQRLNHGGTNVKSAKVWRTMMLLAMGATTLGLLGGTFGPTNGLGCNYANLGDYAAMYQASGDAVIQAVSDNVFGNIGTDYDNVVRNPTTAFAQAVWANWLDVRIPDDLPNNTIVAR